MMMMMTMMMMIHDHIRLLVIRLPSEDTVMEHLLNRHKEYQRKPKVCIYMVHRFVIS